jgi:hypothetical protein
MSRKVEPAFLLSSCLAALVPGTQEQGEGGLAQARYSARKSCPQRSRLPSRSFM